MDNYHSYHSTGGSGGSLGGDGIGCFSWVVIIIAAFLLICFISEGAGWESIDRLLGIGLLAFLITQTFCR